MGRKCIQKGDSLHGFYNSGGKYKTRVDGIKTQECRLWENLRLRVQYLPGLDEGKFGKYSDVRVCEDWKDFQNFAGWVESIKYRKAGWQLDKDLLGNGLEYNPDVCTFLPEEVNKALNFKSRQGESRELPSGICKVKTHPGKILVQYSCKDPEYKIQKFLNEEEIGLAVALYKTGREGYIRSLANKYKEVLDPRAYVALSTYEVNQVVRV